MKLMKSLPTPVNATIMPPALTSLACTDWAGVAALAHSKLVTDSANVETCHTPDQYAATSPLWNIADGSCPLVQTDLGMVTSLFQLTKSSTAFKVAGSKENVPLESACMYLPPIS